LLRNRAPAHSWRESALGRADESGEESVSAPSTPTGSANGKAAHAGGMKLRALSDRPPLPVRAARRLIAECASCLLRLRGAQVGRGVYFGTQPQLHGLPGLILGDRVNLGRRARLETHRTERGQGQLTIGSGAHIGNDFHAGAAIRVVIGRNCMFASGVTILDHDHDFSNPLDPLQCAEGLVAAPTVIEDNVFLGDHVVVLKGVRIGNGSVIGANSVVTHDIPPFTMAAGAPARPLRSYDESSGRWERIGREGGA
jgi:lipopolysaccharide O-acetyltransferase